MTSVLFRDLDIVNKVEPSTLSVKLYNGVSIGVSRLPLSLNKFREVRICLFCLTS